MCLRFDAAGTQGQRFDAVIGDLVEGVGDGGGDGDDGGFAGADGGEVGAVEEDRFELGSVAEAGDAVGGEGGIFDLAVLELDGFEESAAEALNDGSFDLVFQMVGVQDLAALEGGDGAEDAEFSGGGIDGDFGAGGD